MSVKLGQGRYSEYGSVPWLKASSKSLCARRRSEGGAGGGMCIFIR